jgi:hypothetical protein
MGRAGTPPNRSDAMAQELSYEQLTGFRTTVERLQLSIDVLTPRPVRTSELLAGHPAARALGEVVFSSDPEDSHVPPTLVQVSSIAQLKRMVGVPDEHYEAGMYSDRAIDYPDPLPRAVAELVDTARNKCDLEYRLSDEHFEHVRRAAHAYMHGHSDRVRSYEPMIDALMFPTQVAVFAGVELVIDTRVVVSGSAPVTWNYGSITVEEPGKIVVMTEFNVIAQSFTVIPA